MRTLVLQFFSLGGFAWLAYRGVPSLLPEAWAADCPDCEAIRSLTLFAIAAAVLQPALTVRLRAGLGTRGATFLLALLAGLACYGGFALAGFATLLHLDPGQPWILARLGNFLAPVVGLLAGVAAIRYLADGPAAPGRGVRPSEGQDVVGRGAWIWLGSDGGGAGTGGFGCDAGSGGGGDGGGGGC